MPEARTIRLPRDRESATTLEKRDRYAFRYAYARSARHQAAGLESFDHLAIREDGQRIIIALYDSAEAPADPQGQSVVDAILDWLWIWTPETTDALVLRSTAQSVLDHLVPAGRGRGTGRAGERQVAAAIVDSTARSLTLLWSGGLRVRIWDAQGERSQELRQGEQETLQSAIIAIENLRRLVIYSDGLAALDERLARAPGNRALDQMIGDLQADPESDDMSYVECWLVSLPALDIPLALAPMRLRLLQEQETIFASWQAVRGAERYELALEGERSQRLLVDEPRWTVEPAWRQPEQTLRVRAWVDQAPGEQTLRVRAWVDQAPGEWSRPLHLDQPAAPPEPEEQAHMPVAPLAGATQRPGRASARRRSPEGRAWSRRVLGLVAAFIVTMGALLGVQLMASAAGEPPARTSTATSQRSMPATGTSSAPPLATTRAPASATSTLPRPSATATLEPSSTATRISAPASPTPRPATRQPSATARPAATRTRTRTRARVVSATQESVASVTPASATQEASPSAATATQESVPSATPPPPSETPGQPPTSPPTEPTSAPPTPEPPTAASETPEEQGIFVFLAAGSSPRLSEKHDNPGALPTT